MGLVNAKKKRCQSSGYILLVYVLSRAHTGLSEGCLHFQPRIAYL